MKHRVVTGLTAATALACALTGCTSSPRSGGGGGHPVSGGTITEVIPADPGNLDPQGSASSAANQLVAFAYDSLVHLDDKGTVVSGLATAWKQDGNKYTFTIGTRATCADGSKVTPSLVAENLNYVANPKNQSPLNGLYMPANASSTASDATHTVVVTTKSPFPFLMNGIAQVPIICSKGLHNRSSLAHGTDGTGPFVLEDALADDHYTYTVRKGYDWGPGGASTSAVGTPDTVIFKVVTNESTAANLLLSGSVNIATVFGPDRDRVAARDLFHQDLQNVAGEFFFNEAPGRPAADENVRKALVTALKLDDLGATITAGHGTPSTGMVTLEPTACHGDTVKGNLPDQNLDAARAALTAGGWTQSGDSWTKDGKPLQITFVYPTDQQSVAAAELTVDQWKKLGVKVNAVSKSNSELQSIIFESGGWDVTSNTLQVQFPSQLVPFLSGPAPAEGTNFAHLDNADYQRLVADASAKEGDTGCAQWLDAERALVKRFDVVPYSNMTVPVWGRDVTFKETANGIDPTTLHRLSS